MTCKLFLVACALCICLLAPVARAVEAPPAAKLLDDFETDRINWAGEYVGSIVSEYATRGVKAFKVVFRAGADYPGITAAAVDLDWTGCDTLRLDVYNPQGSPVNITVRIDDDKSGPSYSSRYNGEFLLVNGQTFLEIPFDKIRAGDRPLDLSRIKVLTIFMTSPPRDATLYLDNLRVTRGPESDASRGKVIPLAVDDAGLASLRQDALDARNLLNATIIAANKRGIGTLEANIALVTADLGLDVRPGLPWFAARKAELYSYVADSCADARSALVEAVESRRPISPVPPIYDSANLRFDGPRLVEKTGTSTDAVLLFSMLYHSQGPLCEYFTPVNWLVHSHSFAGASRYDVERTPLYKAWKEFADTHRVWNGDEGWCGHIVRDSASLGGGSEPVVVCLESPHTREAITEYIKRGADKWTSDPRILANVLGGELSYICYCPRTLEMFRAYLRGRHASIEKLNDAWSANYASFDEISLMPNAREAAANRACWYDWQEFNCRRFVDHAKWVKGIVREVDAKIPVSVGAVTYSLRGDFGRSGVDEENLIREVDDVVLNESGPSTITTDLLWSLSEGAKPMVDFEYHGDVAGILPHFLHGNTAMAMWWWPDKPDTEFPQFNETALPFSWNIPLADVAESLKIGLDVRRIAPAIAAFAGEPAEIAILYSRASMLQVPPEFAAAKDSPYTMELKRAYAASLGLDAPVRFISTKQVLDGKLSRYKVLIVPAATYSHEAEFEAVLDFASKGGSVVILPDSFLSDEYARPRDYLSRIGITVAAPAGRGWSTGAVQRDDFLQGMTSETSAAAVPAENLTIKGSRALPDGASLKAEWTPQAVRVSGAAKPTAFAPDGLPAMFEIPVGKGVCYYLVAPLAADSLNRLLDAVAQSARVARPFRFETVEGPPDLLVEARAVRRGDAVLVYLVNHSDRLARVAMSPHASGEVTDLRDPWRSIDLDVIAVPARRTVILSVSAEGARQ